MKNVLSGPGGGAGGAGSVNAAPPGVGVDTLVLAAMIGAGALVVAAVIGSAVAFETGGKLVVCEVLRCRRS